MTTLTDSRGGTGGKLAAAIAGENLDGAVLLSPEAFTYATGVRVPSHTLMRWRYTGILVDQRGLAAALTVDMEETTLADGLPELPVVGWGEFSDDPMEALASMLEKYLDVDGARIGIEMDFVPAAAMQQLRTLLPRVDWVPCDDMVAVCRSQKTPDELTVISHLARASDDALADALAASSVGDTENDIGARIISSLYTAGISEHRVLIVATGERSQYPNVGPSDRRLQHGDVVRVEVFATSGGYQSGVARTAVCGDVPPRVAELWKSLSGARQAGLDELRPGVDPRVVYRAYLENLGPLRPRAIAFFGHGMGLDLHEKPFISASSTDTIDKGSVLGIEPFAMLPDLGFGLQVKDVVSVVDGGYQVLSTRLDGGQLHVIG